MKRLPDGRIGGGACSGTLGRDLAKGAVAGAVARWAMDQVLKFLYDHEGPAVRRRETRARGGIPALEAMAERGAAGTTLTARERQKAGTALQWTVGIGMGALYGALRGRLPGARTGRGWATGPPPRS